MEYFKCENEDCGAMYFTDAAEGSECVHCKTGITMLSDDEAVKFLASKMAWAAEHPTVSC